MPESFERLVGRVAPVDRPRNGSESLNAGNDGRAGARPDRLTEVNGKFCWIFFDSRINDEANDR